MRLVIRSVGVNGSMNQILDSGVGLMMRKAEPIFVTANEVQFLILSFYPVNYRILNEK